MDEVGCSKPDPLTVRKELNATIIGFARLGPRATEIPLIIGDAIHNLRAALDHIWVALAVESAPPEKRDTTAVKFATFPFHELRQNVKAAVEKGLIKEAFPDTERLILDEIRPHSDAGGDHVFWAITKLDKIDKHNLIVPTVQFHSFEETTVRAGGSTFRMTNVTMSNVGAFGSFAGPVEYEHKGRASIEITFPKNEPLGGESVIPTLTNMADSTRKAVNLFRETFG